MVVLAVVLAVISHELQDLVRGLITVFDRHVNVHEDELVSSVLAVALQVEKRFVLVHGFLAVAG